MSSKRGKCHSSMTIFWELLFDELSFVSSTSAVICYPLAREKESQSSLQVLVTKLYWNDNVCLPERNTKRRILRDNHESVSDPHKESQKTLRVVRRIFTVLNYIKRFTTVPETVCPVHRISSSIQNRPGT